MMSTVARNTCPRGGFYVVEGEVNYLITVMRQNKKSSSKSHQESLIKGLMTLKEFLKNSGILSELLPTVFLAPFLDIVRSEDTTAPITSLALTAINKIITYGLIDDKYPGVSTCVEAIADAATHTQFLETDTSIDEVVFMKILQILRALILTPAGNYLSDESICDIMISCFRICFGSSLSELLRRTAEHCLRDIIHHLFSRLPEFVETQVLTSSFTKIQTEGLRISRDQTTCIQVPQYQQQIEQNDDNNVNAADFSNKLMSEIEYTTATISGNNIDMQGSLDENTSSEITNKNFHTNDMSDNSDNKNSMNINRHMMPNNDVDDKSCNDIQSNENNFETTIISKSQHHRSAVEQYVNLDVIQLPSETIKEFSTHDNTIPSDSDDNPKNDSKNSTPYGVLCMRELFRFLVSLCNPLDKQNTEIMTHLGLNFLQVALETSADALSNFPSLLAIVQDELPRNLILLLNNERISILVANLQVAFLLFESQREHLKFQFEHYLLKLMEIIESESKSITYDQRELALETIIKLWRVPGLPAELYLNYDCGLYTTDLNEKIINILTKNAAAMENMNTIQSMSLEAMILLIADIEMTFHSTNVVTNLSRHVSSMNIPTYEELIIAKENKQWLAVATDEFNKNPHEGITKLMKHELFSSSNEPDTVKIAKLLRDNPMLDKQAIADYISKRENSNILVAFIKNLDVNNMRIDQALRFFLETFRLPGEAALIFNLLEIFAEHWHNSNGRPFASADAAFTLAYAIILLNVDQHNATALLQNPPMTVEQFKKNLKGQNGDGDFDEEILNDIYKSIKNEEIVMPAEQSGLIKENYLWKVVLRRGASPESLYLIVGNNREFVNRQLAVKIWMSIINTLCAIYEKTSDRTIQSRVAQAFLSCAATSNHYNLTNDLDTLVVSLYNFTGLSMYSKSDDTVLHFGSSRRRLLAARILFRITRLYGSGFRGSWKYIVNCLCILHKTALLPDDLTNAEDFFSAAERELIIAERAPKQPEPGIFASIYSYIASDSPRVPHPNETTARKRAVNCIANCCIKEIIEETKLLSIDSLRSLVDALVCLDIHDEDSNIFLLEILLDVATYNADRIASIWTTVLEYIDRLLTIAAKENHQYLCERVLLGMIRLAINLLRDETFTWTLWPLLIPLSRFSSELIAPLARQISNGLFKLLKSGAVYIHNADDWKIVFNLLEFVGAGALVIEKRESDVHHDNRSGAGLLDAGKVSPVPECVLVSPTACESPLPIVIDRIIFNRDFITHNSAALIKCCECLSFIIHDMTHVTPFNIELCIGCLRTFAEAILQVPTKRIQLTQSALDTPGYQQCPVVLVELMYTLHTNAAELFKQHSMEDQLNMWNQVWKPILQGIARISCDNRQSIRTVAMTYLQKALLSDVLVNLSADEWSQCFKDVLFPLLAQLLNPIACNDAAAVEETRVRVSMLLSRVFLHNLTKLLTSPEFLVLWLTVLNLLRSYMNADSSELLVEAIPETLKNMLLVMSSTEDVTLDSNIWKPTWKIIDSFLPHLKSELFPEPPAVEKLISDAPTDEVINLVTLVNNEEPKFEGSIVVQPELIRPIDQFHQQDHQSQSVQAANNIPAPQVALNNVKEDPQISKFQAMEKDQQHIISLIDQQPPCVSRPIAVQPTTESLEFYQTNQPNPTQQQIHLPEQDTENGNVKVFQDDSTTYRYFVVTNP